MRYISFALVICFSLLSPVVKAQIPYVNSRDVILKGIDMYDKEEYKRAIELFRQVHECDTNYSIAVYELVNALIVDSQYTEAKQLAKMSLDLPGSTKRSALIQLASCYDYMHQIDSAVILYDSLIKMYPNDHQGYYEKGVAYFNSKDYDKAVYNFQKALIINPNHFRSHYMLGKAYALQGRLTEALMASESALLATKNADLAKQAIAVISAITEQTDDVKKAYAGKKEKYNNSSFDEIDQIINAKLAINPSYKLKISINDNIFRQTQAMMEKLKFDASDTCFAMQYYVPYYTQIYKQDLFEGFMLLTFSDFGIENVDVLAKRKTNEINDAKQIVFPTLNKIQSTRELNYNKRENAKELYHFVNESEIIIVGTVAKVGNDNVIQGDAVIYRTDQSLLGKGRYTDKGDKEGPWKYYYKTNGLMKEETYKEGIAIGITKEYSLNGCLSKITHYDDKGNTIQEDNFTNKGWMSYSAVKITDNENEETSYYQNGNKEMAVHFLDKNIKDGEYTSYYESGKRDKVVNFKNGNYTGNYKKYYESGALNEETTFENGKMEGAFVSYYENGKISKKTISHNGKYDGLLETYYEDGSPDEVCTYKKNRKNGLDKKFGRNGKLYGEAVFEDDVPVSIKYYDLDGKLIYEQNDKNGLHAFSSFYQSGNKSADQILNGDGVADGLQVSYYSTGAKSEEVSYKNGNKDGRASTYYKNGKLKAEVDYIQDTLDGYYKGYYFNGIVQAEGWYKEGKKQGLWKYYNPNGKMQSEAYFINDQWNGYNKEYNKNGYIQTKYMYDYDMLVACVVYDSLGKKVDSINYPQGNGKFTCVNKNGKRFTEQEGTLKYGSLEGVLTTKYFNGQISQKMYFKEGKRDSILTIYYPDGKLQNVTSFRNGMQEGSSKSYNELGDLVDDGIFINNQPDGKRNSYANNRLCIAYNFKGGEKDGAQNYYGEDGKIACILNYDDGDLISYTYEGKDGKLVPAIPVKYGTADIKAFYSNGKKSAEINTVKSMFNGTAKIYFSNGNVAEERNCKDDGLNGVFKRYAKDGKLVYEMSYTDNEETGVENTYDNNGVLLISKSYFWGDPHGVTTVRNAATGKTTKYIYHYGELINVTE